MPPSYPTSLTHPIASLLFSQLLSYQEKLEFVSMNLRQPRRQLGGKRDFERKLLCCFSCFINFSHMAEESKNCILKYDGQIQITKGKSIFMKPVSSTIKTFNLAVSCCSFVGSGKEMYRSVQPTSERLFRLLKFFFCVCVVLIFVVVLKGRTMRPH